MQAFKDTNFDGEPGYRRNDKALVETHNFIKQICNFQRKAWYQACEEHWDQKSGEALARLHALSVMSDGGRKRGQYEIVSCLVVSNFPPKAGS